MKKLAKISSIILLLVSSISVNAQVILFSEDFDGVSEPLLPTSTQLISGTTDNIETFSGYPCDVPGSSGANSLISYALAAAGSTQGFYFGPLNATAFTNLQVYWNGARNPGSPILSLSYSTDGVVYNNVPYTDVTNDGSWYALSPVFLPAASYTCPTLYIKLEYDMATGSTGDFFAFDDFVVEGDQNSNYYWKGLGDLDLLTSWGKNTNGTGAMPPDFLGPNKTFNIKNGSSATIGADWTLGTAVNVVVGDTIAAASVNFTIPPTFSLSINSASGSKLFVANNGTLTLQNSVMPAPLEISLKTGSTVDYNQSSLVNVIRTTHQNLTVSGTSNKKQPTTGIFNVNGILNLNGVDFEAAPSLWALRLNGTVSGSGAIVTTTASPIQIGGTGSLGTITFTSASLPISCGNLILNRTSSGSIILGSDIEVNGTFQQTNGSIDLNGKSLTLKKNITFPASIANGSIKGSATSSLTISGAGSITNSLLMDQSSATTRALYDLEMNRTGATLTAGNTLDILNSITPTLGTIDFNGNVTLKSTSALKARLGIVGGSVSGNLKVETFIPGGSAGWANLGPAGVSGLSVTNWDGGSGSSTSIAMSCSGCINNEVSAGGYFVSIQSDPSGTGSYLELTASSPLTPGEGYWIYVANSLTSAADITQTTSGPAVTGNVMSGNTFMSNPYASPISVDNIKLHEPALTSIDVYDANTGAYVSFNGGVPSAAVIPMGQAFYANGVPNILFQESDKVADNTAAFGLLKTTASYSVGNVVELKINSAYNEIDKTYIRFHGGATPNFDNNLDAYKRYATPGYLGYPGPYTKYTTIATVNSNLDYAINSLPYALTTDAVIPVIVKVSATGQYTIGTTSLYYIAPTACVILRDKLLGIDHNLRTGSYICNINDTTSVARFELKICADITAGINEVKPSNSDIQINQDVYGAYVKTKFETSTKATISAYNMMGQKIMTDKEIEGKENTTYLNLGNTESQIVIIRVTTAKESVVKKIYLN
jgi:hypothetical protein